MQKNAFKSVLLLLSYLSNVLTARCHAGQNGGRRGANVGPQGQRVHPLQAKK
jgi:hypothetical protein